MANLEFANYIQNDQIMPAFLLLKWLPNFCHYLFLKVSGQIKIAVLLPISIMELHTFRFGQVQRSLRGIVVDYLFPTLQPHYHGYKVARLSILYRYFQSSIKLLPVVLGLQTFTSRTRIDTFTGLNQPLYFRIIFVNSMLYLEFLISSSITLSNWIMHERFYNHIFIKFRFNRYISLGESWESY